MVYSLSCRALKFALYHVFITDISCQVLKTENVFFEGKGTRVEVWVFFGGLIKRDAI